MSVLVADCPRCGSKRITFELERAHSVAVQYGWQEWFEAFCICRNCSRSTVFVLSQKHIGDNELIERSGLVGLKDSINNHFNVETFVGTKDQVAVRPPEHLPKEIESAFKEGATCLSVGCYNAAGTMFRLCIDLATKGMLPKDEADGLNYKTRRDLGLRLPWLFKNGLLPEALQELSSCIKDDGNDGAHAGTLSRDDALDLVDFTEALLERIYTEPRRLEFAKARREARREPKPQK